MNSHGTAAENISSGRRVLGFQNLQSPPSQQVASSTTHEAIVFYEKN
jgi:hypothetical protein